MKRSIWAGLVFSTALTLTACSAPALEDKPAAVVPSEDSVAEESPAPEPPAEEPAEQGTRANPFPKGTTVGTDEVQLALGEVTWNATDIVAAENQFNEPAAEGSTYAIVPVTITNVSQADAVQPWLAFDVSFVADDGRSFEEEYVVVPAPLSDVDDLYAGGVGTGNLVFALPNDVSGGGVWAIEETFAFGDPVFVAAH
ncbi:hypothetical protein [Cellulomonas sp.]|uniref:hypothetical protein n=1 Tax=Cellulomonas sp. TaxID=40001 RepID=UPI003BAA8BAA